MVRKVEIPLAEETFNLLGACIHPTMQEQGFDKFAEFLPLHGLLSHCQSIGDDGIAKNLKLLSSNLKNCDA